MAGVDRRTKQRNRKKEIDKQHGFMRFMMTLFASFYDLVKTNLLFLVTSIPIVTIPSGISAMAYGTLVMAEGSSVFTAGDYFTKWKQKFGKSLASGALFFVLTGACGASVLLYMTLAEEYSPLFYILAAAGAALTISIQMVAVCFFPLLSLTEYTIKELFQEAFAVLRGYTLRAFAAALINSALFAASVLLFPESVIFVLFIAFSFISFIASYLLRSAFLSYLPTAEGEGSEESNH